MVVILVLSSACVGAWGKGNYGGSCDLLHAGGGCGIFVSGSPDRFLTDCTCMVGLYRSHGSLGRPESNLVSAAAYPA
jgi:hypothetical protein